MANFDPYYVKISNAAPSSYDWRNYNKVCEVQDQGSCGSCWAFATIDGICFCLFEKIWSDLF